MVSRSTRIVVEVVIGVLAAVALLGGMAVWRLSAGPIALDFLSPYLEESFAESESDLVLEVGGTTLSWEGWARTFDLRVHEVRVREADGSTVAALPAVSVNLSIPAMFRGMLAPTEIDVVDARVTLARQPNGRFTLASAESLPEGAAGEAPEFSGVLPALVRHFLQEPDPGNPLGYLTAVRVVGGQLFVIDRRLDTLWFAPDADMEMRRHEQGVAVSLGLKVALGPELANATAAVLFDQPRQTVTVAARLADFHAGALAAVLPVPAVAAGLDVPLSADLQADLTPDGRLVSARFDVAGGAGEMSVPTVLPEGRALAGLSLRGAFDGAARRLEIKQAELRFGTPGAPGPTVGMTATLEDDGEAFRVAGEARADRLAADDLGRFWSPELAASARAWVVENIHEGTAEDGRLAFSLRVPKDDVAAAELVELDGSFAYEGLAVHYLRPMAPITGIAGRAHLDADSLRFQAETGRMGELSVEGAEIDILELAGDTHMTIDGRIDGPLRAALRVVDHERLDLLTHLGIAPETTAGAAEVDLSIAFPLRRDLGFEHVEVSASSTIREGSVDGFLLDRDASAMNLALDVDRRGMSVSGPMRLAEVPVDLTWREDFTGEAEARTVLELAFAKLDGAERRRLGLDLAPYVTGPISASLIATLGQNDAGTVKLAANLASSRLSLPFLDWTKPPEQDGELRLTAEIADEAVQRVERFDLAAGTLLARGRAELSGAGEALQELRFDRLAFHGTTLNDVAVTRQGEDYVIDLGEGVVDAAMILEDDSADEKTQEGAEKEGADEKGAAEDETAQPAMPFDRALTVVGRDLSAVYFAEGRYLRDVTLRLESSPAGWERVILAGEVPDELWRRGGKRQPNGEGERAAAVKTFDLVFEPTESGNYVLDVRMNDMGAGLRALGVIDTVVGGNLEITGTSAGPAPNHPLKGRIEAQDYTLVKAPVMTQILSLASLTGIANVLSGEGLEFKRLVGEFTLEKGVARSELIRAYGNALGLTAEGSVDFGGDEIDLHGTLVPAYTVNRLIGQIPLLGPLLVGGEGEGIVAVTYRLDGPLDDPDVSVNPLSVLTPGFLRGLFEVSGAEKGQNERPRVFPRAIER